MEDRNLVADDPPKFIGYGPAFTKAAGGVTLKPNETHEIKLELK